jgi:orotidine-5'-phosphate decarboxylase
MTPDLIVALDVSSATEAAALVRRIGDAVSFYKVGLELFIADGPDTLAMLSDRGKRVFLDLKLHDIPRTVERAVASASRFGAELLTLHAAGGRAMIQAAARAAADAGTEMRLLAVTVLTSLDDRDLVDIGVQRAAADQVDALGRLAIAAGAHGLVCSPQEVGRLRTALGPAPYLVTPGVRPAGGAVGDQKRVATPAQATRDGASALVVGRPILEASDPRAAALAIAAECASAR